MAYLTRRFQKMVRRNGDIPKKGISSKPKNYDLYHKCGQPGHFIKDCHLLKQEHFKHNSDKAAKRNPVPDKRFKRKSAADNVVKQALAAWGDSSSESEEENTVGDSSMLAVESEATEYDSIFALIAQSDDNEDDDNDDVNFRDVQRNLKSYSPKKLMSLATVLIDAYHILVSDKDALTIELGDAGQTRDDLVVCIVDLKETIENMKNEKEVLTEKIASVEHERDDLMVIVVDLKETTENLSKEKNALVEKVAITEQERYDLLVVIADLEEIIEELKADSRPGNSEKGKEIASEAHTKLENELNIVKTSLCVELEKNRQLQAELEKVKNDLEKSLKWTWSSNAITAMYFNNGGNRQGIGFQREKVPYNPHSKYVTVPDNWLCTNCRNNGHFKENCQARVQSIQKNKVFAEKVTTGREPGNSERKQSTMDHGQKKGYILGVGKIGKSLSHSIENVYYVNDLKYNLLSVSQICDKGNKMEFLSKICTITTLVTGEVVSMAKRYKNIYVADFESLQCGDMSCLKAIDDDAKLWHRRLGHASFSLLNKLIQKDLVRGLPSSKLKEHKVWHLVPRPSDRTIIGTRWVFRNKLDEHGNTTMNKAMLVVQGYNQEEGIDYDETFTPVARMEAIRILIAFASHMEFTLFQMDVKSAFLNGFLKEEVYVKQPPGFECHKHPEYVFKLDKKRGRNLLIVHVYVDDIIFGATADSLCEEFAKLIGSEFETSMMGELNFFLGLQVKQSTKGTCISQQKYIKEILKRFDMEASKVIDTAAKLDMDELALMFQSNLKESHLKAAKRILRYLMGTQDLVLYYPSGDNFNLVGYADADYAGYLVDKKSTSGMAHFL
ncbi:uncharacterized protein [Nicotiana tomentosiformis]|uniref:uncharacterized protein n=1 Tax=Nicotiana tomentosiformis TaxID=4098 RepID=UPI00388C5945